MKPREGTIVHGTVREYGGGAFMVTVAEGTSLYPGLGTEGVWVPKEIYEELFRVKPGEFGIGFGVRSPDDHVRQIVREEINTAILGRWS